MERFCHARHPPNSGLLPALSIIVQLLAWLPKVSSCDLSSSPAAALKLNKVSIQFVVFTHMCLEVSSDLWCVYVLFVFRVKTCQGDKVMRYICYSASACTTIRLYVCVTTVDFTYQLRLNAADTNINTCTQRLIPTIHTACCTVWTFATSN